MFGTHGCCCFFVFVFFNWCWVIKDSSRGADLLKLPLNKLSNERHPLVNRQYFCLMNSALSQFTVYQKSPLKHTSYVIKVRPWLRQTNEGGSSITSNDTSSYDCFKGGENL